MIRADYFAIMVVGDPENSVYLKKGEFVFIDGQGDARTQIKPVLFHSGMRPLFTRRFFCLIERGVLKMCDVGVITPDA